MEDRETLLQRLADILKAEMVQQIRTMGHVMTGQLVESVESRISQTVTSANIEILVESYGLALNDGVPPERIPFTEPDGRGGRSKYIEGLQRFAQLKLGVTDNRESLSVAFAIARKQKQKGMPIAGPSRFIEKTVEATQAEIDKFVEDWAASVFAAQLEVFFNKQLA